MKVYIREVVKQDPQYHKRIATNARQKNMDTSMSLYLKCIQQKLLI